MYRRSLQRLGCRRGGPSLMRPSSPLLCTFQPNLTSMTNQVNRNEHHKKFGGSVSMGIPRISRLQVRSIAVLHETPRVMVVGRNYSNGFANNQFLIVNKQNNECIFIDACDDWPDDWVAFLSASKLTPTHVFLTHCHVDNVINLNALMSIVEQHMGLQLGIMWCQAELPWVQEFHRACERYGRMEEARQSLPMLRSNLYSYYTYAHQLHNKQRALHSQMKESTSSNGEISTPPLPQLVRQKDILHKPCRVLLRIWRSQCVALYLHARALPGAHDAQPAAGEAALHGRRPLLQPSRTRRSAVGCGRTLVGEPPGTGGLPRLYRAASWSRPPDNVGS